MSGGAQPVECTLYMRTARMASCCTRVDLRVELLSNLTGTAGAPPVSNAAATRARTP